MDTRLPVHYIHFPRTRHTIRPLLQDPMAYKNNHPNRPAFLNSVLFKSSDLVIICYFLVDDFLRPRFFVVSRLLDV